MKWLQGWKDGGAWTGASTVAHAWRDNCDNKPSGCSWYAYGLIMAQQQRRGRQLESAEYREILAELHDTQARLKALQA